MTQIEIAVQDAAGARVARDNGADRVELCSALACTGGLTPSLGTVETVVATGIPAHVLIRPRPGGFQYDAEEIDLMVRDVEHCAAAGAAGVVIGVLGPDGHFNTAAMTRLVAAAAGLEVTCHRAFDIVPTPLEALHELGAMEIFRVLTSGGAPTVGEGLDRLAALVEESSGVQIMAGGGLRVADVPALLRANISAVHLSASVPAPVRTGSGPGGGSGEGHLVTDAGLVAAAVAAVRG